MSNLPPGCSVSDIPGNRPEDLEWENAIDWIVDEANRMRLSTKELVLAWRLGAAALETALQYADDYSQDADPD